MEREKEKNECEKNGGEKGRYGKEIIGKIIEG